MSVEEQFEVDGSEFGKRGNPHQQPCQKANNSGKIRDADVFPLQQLQCKNTNPEQVVSGWINYKTKGNWKLETESRITKTYLLDATTLD